MDGYLAVYVNRETEQFEMVGFRSVSRDELEAELENDPDISRVHGIVIVPLEHVSTINLGTSEEVEAYWRNKLVNLNPHSLSETAKTEVEE